MCLYLVDYFNSKPFFPVRENFKVTITRHLKVLKKCSSEEDVLPAQGIWKGFGLIDIISDWYPGSIRIYDSKPFYIPNTSILEGGNSVVNRPLFPKPGAQYILKY